MRRRRLVWSAVALALLLAGALLLSFGADEPVRTERPQVAFPNGMREAERERARSRATLALAVPASASAAAEAPPPRRDPFLVALPVRPGDPVLVLEANALRHSRLGEHLVGCLLARDPAAFTRIAEETGVDVLKDVDRIGFVGEAAVVSGFFDGARWDRVAHARGERYGERGRLWRGEKAGGAVVGAWGDGLLFVSPDDDAVRRAIDQLEGRAPMPDAAIPERLAYGEVYGVVPGTAARALLGGRDAELAGRIAEAARSIELHADAMQDVAAVVRIRGGSGLDDLGRALGGVLAGARVEAQARGDARLSELLDAARVVPGEEGFSVEVAVPAERLDAWFAGCGGAQPASGEAEYDASRSAGSR